jgi:hypothetical protein
VASFASLVEIPAHAQTPTRAPTVLTVHAAKPVKPVDHAASGSLYGIGDQGWPPDAWIAPTRPKMFTQPPPGATQLPNQEPAPVGDTLKVWPTAARNGAMVTIRLPDIFPTFPYQWLGDDYWYAHVETMVRAKLAAGANNIYGYEIWNEPQWTWNPSWGDYFTMWQRTYHLIRSLDPTTPIIGPSYDRDYENGLRQFMTIAVASGTVPDIVSWHELGPVEGLNVANRVTFYRALEQQLGVSPRRISINEYGSPRDAGVPGWLARFVARMERTKVDTANLAFWHKPGRLSDLLVPVGGGSGPAIHAEPTGNYWLFEWYGDMTGQMVETTGPAETGRFIEVGHPVPVAATRAAGQSGFGNAIALNGSAPNQYVELPTGVVAGVHDFTVATWVNPGVQRDWQRVFDFGTGQQVYMFLTVRTGAADAANSPRFSITTNGGGGEQQISRTLPAPLPSNQWTHVAITKSGTMGTMYVNGEAVGSNPNMTLSPADLGTTNQNWIGRSQYADPLLEAAVDEFQIYDHALTAAEVQSLLATPGGSAGGGNLAWYRFDEPAGAITLDSSVRARPASVITATQGSVLVPALDGFASADRSTGTVRVIFGGGNGDVQLAIDGLQALERIHDLVHVQVFTTEWTGTDGVSDGPAALFEGDYQVHGGAISIPVSGLKETDGYLAIIRPAPRRRDFERSDRAFDRRLEAEDALDDRDPRRLSIAASPLASGNRYVVPAARGGELTFVVNAPVAGAYDLGIRYANASGPAASGALVVNDRQRTIVDYPSTTADAPFATRGTSIVLAKGVNKLRLRLESRSVSVDYIEVTPFRARFEAETGTWSDATLVQQDMSESNFFASYFSGDAYVSNLSEPTSSLRLPITVPAAGTYQLRIGYSTEGEEAERRAQIPSGHVLRINHGAWQPIRYAPTQFREMIRQVAVNVELPAGTSTITLAKSNPDVPGDVQPGIVDLDYIDIELVH